MRAARQLVNWRCTRGVAAASASMLLVDHYFRVGL
jgi:hypothetical protein